SARGHPAAAGPGPAATSTTPDMAAATTRRSTLMTEREHLEAIRRLTEREQARQAHLTRAERAQARVERGQARARARTEPGQARRPREKARGAQRRKPSAVPVAFGSIAAFMALFGFMAYQLRTGHDPAL